MYSKGSLTIICTLSALLLFSGCVNVNFNKNNSTGPQISGSQVLEECGDRVCGRGEDPSCPQDCAAVSPGPVAPGPNSPPRLSTSSLDPSNPDLGEVFTLSINALDDKGVRYVFWKSSKPVFIEGNPNPVNGDFYDCAFQPTCSASFGLRSEEEGQIQIEVYADDSVGNESPRTNFEAVVRPFRSTTRAAVCGNGTCESGETPDNCEADCAIPDCAGGGCTPGNAAVCGNSTCDAGESFGTCPQDCPSQDGGEGTCSTNSDCGYKQICRSGTCESVDCTNDAQCTGCRRCSDNTCRSCGYSPYGVCYC